MQLQLLFAPRQLPNQTQSPVSPLSSFPCVMQ